MEAFGVKGSGRVWIETGTPGGGHTLLLQECVQCWVALGPCAAGYCEYSCGITGGQGQVME